MMNTLHINFNNLSKRKKVNKNPQICAVIAFIIVEYEKKTPKIQQISIIIKRLIKITSLSIVNNNNNL